MPRSHVIHCVAWACVLSFREFCSGQASVVSVWRIYSGWNNTIMLIDINQNRTHKRAYLGVFGGVKIILSRFCKGKFVFLRNFVPN